jgi:hypothetical protein
LHQNFPNPFNPVTAISYRLSAASDVELSIYNLLGQKVAILVSERQSAGDYRIDFEAGDLPSGVYIYNLSTSSGYSASRKMVLLK